MLLLISIPIVIIILYLIYFQAKDKISQLKYTDATGLVLFCSAAIAGAIGSFVSVTLRIQGIRDNTQLAQNIYSFKYSLTTVQIAPLTGMVFALLLSLIIYGGLVGGSMFPNVSIKLTTDSSEIDPNSYTQVLNNIAEFSKLLVWSFIAGFSERLIPDMVDRLSDKARKAEEKFAN